MTALGIDKWMGVEGELVAGHKLVPWSHWDQWNFVRESLFSKPSELVIAALQRIAAWRSRGCLPIAIEVSAAIIETHQRDRYYSEGTTGDKIDSEELLAMLYSMAITRFVNGFVENVNNADRHARKYAFHKKHSVHELADAIGIPRIVVDIRHESSHRDLPSLPILRLASAKALEWLKSNYWESQKKMIPNVRNEVACRLYQLVSYIKADNAGKSVPKHQRRTKQFGSLFVRNKLSSQISAKLLISKNKGFAKLIRKTTKDIMRLYSEYPMEVILSLLGLSRLRRPISLESAEADCYHFSNLDVPHGCGSTDDLKVIIAKLSSERPGFLMTLLNEVLGMIEAHDVSGDDKGQFATQSVELQKATYKDGRLSSLVPWLINYLKQFEQSGHVVIADDPQSSLSGKDYVSKVSLKNLLKKCLLFSVSGDKHFVDSALLLAEMIYDSSSAEKLRRLSSANLDQSHRVDQDSSDVNLEYVFSKEVACLKQAALDLNILRSRIKVTASEGIFKQDEVSGSNRKWTMPNSWIPCPIGMLPCSLAISPVLPNLDVVGCNELEGNRPAMDDNVTVKDAVCNKRDADSEPVSLGYHGLPKKLKGDGFEKGAAADVAAAPMEGSFPKKLEGDGFEKGAAEDVATAPLEGRLLINGIWKKVGQEELKTIASEVRILVK